MHTRAGTRRDGEPPYAGEQIMIFSPSGDTAAGTVPRGINSSAHPAPSALGQ
ncbi:hypothetical protein GQF02_01925 [Neisseriaceae bacterium B2N2-7]|uniref:Uncharacterized protein n=1 Tax=Craterilacuibacter sinensis TaxID=2686017 RepID=A0A845BHX0_9NEIS|nr:hypothetical protein [Craterilacuibacter sinensis]